jgi:hypothetical protein
LIGKFFHTHGAVDRFRTLAIACFAPATTLSVEALPFFRRTISTLFVPVVFSLLHRSSPTPSNSKPAEASSSQGLAAPAPAT